MTGKGGKRIRRRGQNKVLAPFVFEKVRRSSEWQKKRKRPGPGGAYADKPNETLVLSIGDCDDALEGCALLRQLGLAGYTVYLLMGAYKDDEIRSLAMELGYIIMEDTS